MANSTTPAAAATPTPTPPPPPICFDERWKLSKKEMMSSSRTRSLSSSSSTRRSKSRRCSFTRRCARLIREQRARFYIMRRCVTMLVCWHDYGDS